jgi:hypothetical protein
MAVFSSFIACNLYTAAFMPNSKKKDGTSSEEDELGVAGSAATIVPNRIALSPFRCPFRCPAGNLERLLFLPNQCQDGPGTSPGHLGR